MHFPVEHWNNVRFVLCTVCQVVHVHVDVRTNAVQRSSLYTERLSDLFRSHFDHTQPREVSDVNTTRLIVIIIIIIIIYLLKTQLKLTVVM